ncbi:MAG: indole-3-glycerol phosphate synthase TrpC [Bacteroidetes bacterium]|nr:MAG: indole-3-glycerol phosphate synthase TrpC [Bacteroidota bacterium]
MNILDEIIAHKRAEVKESKELYPVKLLERSPYYQAQPVSLKKYLLREDLSGVIAEFKRKSPSKGVINEFADPATVCLEYMQAGASALSVITNTRYFGGTIKDLTTARRFNFCPILRKEFIVDEYQVIEARSIGADAILLIAEVLTREELKTLSALARELQMEVLFEIHEEENIDKLPAEAQIIGINNRNLKNLSVSIEHSLQLLEKLPANAMKIAESGIDSPEAAIRLKEAGFSGLLMGERFMREANPGKACKLFIKGMKKLMAEKSVIQ